MLYQWVADGVVLVHLAFLVFLGTGSLLAWRWPRLVWLHLPSVAWGLVSITVGLDCPLTPLENHFRRLAGERGYGSGFVDHYIEGVVYPERFTPHLRLLMGAAVVAGYTAMIRKKRRRHRLHGHVLVSKVVGSPSGLPSRPNPERLRAPEGAAGFDALVQADHSGLHTLHHPEGPLQVPGV